MTKRTLTIIIVSGALLVLIGSAGIGYLAVWGQNAPPADPLNGAIAIPADLLPHFDKAITDIKVGQDMVKQAQPKLEQVLRIVLDRAGVAPDKFNDYSLNVDKKLLEKKPASQQAPIQ